MSFSQYLQETYGLNEVRGFGGHIPKGGAELAAKRANKIKARMGIGEEVNYVLSHLIDEGYTDNYESAEIIYESMSDEWLYEILDEANRGEREILSQLSPGMRSKMGRSIVRGLRSQRDRATDAQRRREQNTPSRRKREANALDYAYTYGGFSG